MRRGGATGVTVYKWLDGRQATHVHGFRYRLRVWTPRVEGELVACKNGYHLCRERNLPYWISRDLFLAETDEPEEEWLVGSNKVVVRRCRIVEHLQGWNERTALLFAADCAERVLPLWERPDDDRPRLAIQVARDFARGLVGEEELRHTREAADDAAASASSSSAASYAAYAARSAAYAARSAATYSGYSAAASAAASAASSAAAARAAASFAAARWPSLPPSPARAAASFAADSEREWQGQRILDYAHGRIS
ncbi:MAG: hypothetical protein KatS3mg015_2524 [Fimbriimonadales bacterium]|nr:MAG: hypothetical protein KatS3mg015_2524 [Fimbriimonadales bacterium]